MSEALAMGALPRGRHHLSRDQVEESQRLRLAVAMADVLAERGFAKTPVAAVLERAGVSRQTFYQLYDDKLDCFLDALDLVGTVLVSRLGEAVGGENDPVERAVAAVDQYLETIIGYPTFARLYIVEVHAAGPGALLRRAALQGRVVDALASLVGATDERGRFACEAYVAAISALVTLPIVTGDVAALRRLRDPLVDQLRDLAAATG
jgi:AcrR family transcriptional regulator